MGVGTWLLFLCGVGIFLWQIVEIHTLNQTLENLQPRKYFLSALVIAKNEAMVLPEFLQHLQEQGFDHVFLIDNGSTDQACQRAVRDMGTQFLTLYERPEPHQQVAHYNWVYQRHRHDTSWLAVIDVDEFLFGVEKPLRQVLLNTPPQYFALPWIMFGSSHHIQQPASIRESFLYRHPISSEPNYAAHPRYYNIKSLFHTALVRSLCIHQHICMHSCVRIITLPQNDPQIRLHHYAIMSWQYFSTVKMTRGDVASQGANSVRDRAYFDLYDTPAVVYDNILQQICQAQRR